MQTIDGILQEFSSDRKELITILHRVQEAEGYIPREAVAAIARHLSLTPNEVFGVITFYAAFSLTPKGRSVIKVCLGTACHVRGGVQIADEFGRRLSLAPGETSPDGSFTLETVNCLGCCAIGPVVLADGEYYGHVAVPGISRILDKHRPTHASAGRRTPDPDRGRL